MLLLQAGRVARVGAISTNWSHIIRSNTAGTTFREGNNPHPGSCEGIFGGAEEDGHSVESINQRNYSERTSEILNRVKDDGAPVYMRYFGMQTVLRPADHPLPVDDASAANAHQLQSKITIINAGNPLESSITYKTRSSYQA